MPVTPHRSQKNSNYPPTPPPTNKTKSGCLEETPGSPMPGSVVDRKDRIPPSQIASVGAAGDLHQGNTAEGAGHSNTTETRMSELTPRRDIVQQGNSSEKPQSKEQRVEVTEGQLHETEDTDPTSRPSVPKVVIVVPQRVRTRSHLSSIDESQPTLPTTPESGRLESKTARPPTGQGPLGQRSQNGTGQNSHPQRARTMSFPLSSVDESQQTPPTPPKSGRPENDETRYPKRQGPLPGRKLQDETGKDVDPKGAPKTRQQHSHNEETDQAPSTTLKSGIPKKSAVLNKSLTLSKKKQDKISLEEAIKDIQSLMESLPKYSPTKDKKKELVIGMIRLMHDPKTYGLLAANVAKSLTAWPERADVDVADVPKLAPDALRKFVKWCLLLKRHVIRDADPMEMTRTIEEINVMQLWDEVKLTYKDPNLPGHDWLVKEVDMQRENIRGVVHGITRT